MINDRPGKRGTGSKSENELLEKLEAWLAPQVGEPTIFDVMATGDGELLAAYILKAFRAAAAQAVADRLEHRARSSFGYDPADIGAAAYRVFAGIAGAWDLSEQERRALLGFESAENLMAVASTPSHELAPEILERLSILVDIFHAINTLLPVEARADAWMRKPNRAPIFEGRSAIALMLDHGVEGMRKLRSYLQSQTF